MNTPLQLIPVTGNEVIDSLRAYEAVHREYMNTPIWGEAGRAIKAKLAEARERYIQAEKKAHPHWIIF